VVHTDHCTVSTPEKPGHIGTAVWPCREGSISPSNSDPSSGEHISVSPNWSDGLLSLDTHIKARKKKKKNDR